jgi:hypothetical protein
VKLEAGSQTAIFIIYFSIDLYFFFNIIKTFTDQPTFLARKASNLFPNPFPIVGTGLKKFFAETVEKF